MKTIELIKRDLPYEVNEELKHLRTNITFCGDDKRVIMMTSSISGEGKSSTSLDLAASFADLGSKVLLIDTDMRKSMMRQFVKDKSKLEYGLSHLLTGQCQLADCLYRTNTNVYVISAGPVPPNPSELLSNRKMENLIKNVRDYFDYIIVDCPPLGAVIDAAVVANYCDGAIIVCEAGKIPYKVLQGVVAQLKNTQCPILGVVLNKVDVKKGRYYKNYYYKKQGYYTDVESEELPELDDIDLEEVDLDEF